MWPKTRRRHEESWWHGRDVLVHEVIAEVAAAFPQCAAVEVVTDGQLRTPSHISKAAGPGPEVFTYAALHAMAMRSARGASTEGRIVANGEAYDARTFSTFGTW